MKYVFTAVIVVAVLAVGAWLFAWSGVYNIAATEHHWGFTRSFLDLVRDRSIQVHSDDIRSPELSTQEFEDSAISHYHEMCRYCHGAPGYPPTEFALGLYPSPPDMTSGHIQEERTDAEIFWTAKYGLKFTGMPAFGPTHGDEDLWRLMGLVKAIPGMNPERYRELVRSAGSENGHGH